jgi:predicted acyltransferase
MTTAASPSSPDRVEGDLPPTPALAPTPPIPATRERLLSLDVFRGLTVAAMLLVNDPGNWGHLYPPLGHAAWHGWTPTDLIFPFFLFIVGITTHLSLSTRAARGDDDGAIRRQILRRGALIFLFGLLLNGFPFFTWAAVPGNADPSFLDRVVHRLEVWRIMGVLQRIALAYMAAALISWRASNKRLVIVSAILLFGYWIVMTLLPVPGTSDIGAVLLGKPSTTMAAWLDRQVLDWSRFGLGNHIWSGSVTWDPEGILSTIPAIGTALLGVLAGRWIATPQSLAERLNGLFAAGALGLLAGSMWNWSFPINKGIWTSSYVLFTAGMACVTLATIMWIADMKGVRGWTKFFVVYGTNPTIAFVGSGIMARCLYSIFRVDYDGERVSVVEAIYRTFLSWGLAPKNASLLFALSFVGVWYLILLVLYRRRIFLKV